MKTTLTNFFSTLLHKDMPATKCPPLREQLEQARHEWLSAQNYYNNVSDADLIDYATYHIQAAEKKYIYLLKRARHEGLRSSPFH
ncbi:YaaL family protein [Sporomusa acidovorans]|uniref:DUF2508 domain-containing protein n=1 Tax=Sporomusa acidovorans (strain ATCC 49682 / DSM 3132 / Mol) TaxID=1123286 RepID=A0ABZ3JAI4_SPOA4|nr:YaaL family protein [Sporomusa acidovorans]OZC21635.1 hypothetical protein SPACI_17090 [Sporomusa acidovorans DSM 3132]SDD61658.1 Protein of unknown function [Sporomusa acidovorans]